jgi:hypothetical protein
MENKDNQKQDEGQISNQAQITSSRAAQDQVGDKRMKSSLISDSDSNDETEIRKNKIQKLEDSNEKEIVHDDTKKKVQEIQITFSDSQKQDESQIKQNDLLNNFSHIERDFDFEKSLLNLFEGCELEEVGKKVEPDTVSARTEENYPSQLYREMKWLANNFHEITSTGAFDSYGKKEEIINLAKSMICDSSLDNKDKRTLISKFIEIEEGDIRYKEQIKELEGSQLNRDDKFVLTEKEKEWMNDSMLEANNTKPDESTNYRPNIMSANNLFKHTDLQIEGDNAEWENFQIDLSKL